MSAFLTGFEIAFSATNLFYCFAGVFIGTLIGVLPGIGPLASVAMLLPVSFYLEPTTALILLGGVYYGSEYGGSTASILLNIPGNTSNAITCLDGYPMARQGRAGVALFTTTVASFIGGSIGIVVMIFLTPLVVAFALSFGPAEYFAAMLFGLLASATVGQGAPIKGIAMVIFGLMLGCIGAEINSGVVRYDFGFRELFDGLSIVVVAMGLFGISELIAAINTSHDEGPDQRVTLRSMVPTREDVRRSILPVLRGTGIGTVFGALPGAGPSIAAFLSYVTEKRLAKDPSRFGKGAIEGIASPEASNNAAVQTAFIPTLALGIPGSATMAIMMSALMVHGIAPGPRLMVDHSDLFWGVVASFWIGNVMLLVLNIPMIGIWVRLLRIPYQLLYPLIVCLVCIGAYSISYSIFDIWMLIVVGFIGYGMRLLEFEPAPLLIAFILGPLMEENFRRTLLLSHGDFSALFLQPIAGSFYLLMTFLIVLTVWSRRRRRGAVPPPALQEDAG